VEAVISKRYATICFSCSITAGYFIEECLEEKEEDIEL
jgi:hypothetical protein